MLDDRSNRGLGSRLIDLGVTVTAFRIGRNGTQMPESPARRAGRLTREFCANPLHAFSTWSRLQVWVAIVSAGLVASDLVGASPSGWGWKVASTIGFFALCFVIYGYIRSLHRKIDKLFISCLKIEGLRRRHTGPTTINFDMRLRSTSTSLLRNVRVFQEQLEPAARAKLELGHVLNGGVVARGADVQPGGEEYFSLFSWRTGQTIYMCSIEPGGGGERHLLLERLACTFRIEVRADDMPQCAATMTIPVTAVGEEPIPTFTPLDPFQ